MSSREAVDTHRTAYDGRRTLSGNVRDTGDGAVHVAGATVWRWLCVLVTLAIVFSACSWLSSYWLFVVPQCAVYMLGALSVVVVRRSCGSLSLCQASLMGVGAYVCSWVFASLHWPFLLSAAMAICAAIVIGFALMLPVRRLRSLEVAVLTLVAALAMDAIFFNPNAPLSVTVNGAVMPRQLSVLGHSLSSPITMYLVVLAVATLAFGGVCALLAGREGRQWDAMRVGDAVSSACGIAVSAHKRIGFAVAAAVAALGGILGLVAVGSSAGANFDVPVSFELVVYVMIFSIESPLGAIGAGALLGAGAAILQVFNLSGNLVDTITGAGTVIIILQRSLREQRALESEKA
jgi:ABC-type branched-subunit amino acid transport system permease subunit